MTSGHKSWNIGDNPLAATLQRTLDFNGPGAKAIVWEHNKHVGVARYHDMPAQLWLLSGNWSVKSLWYRK